VSQNSVITGKRLETRTAYPAVFGCVLGLLLAACSAGGASSTPAATPPAKTTSPSPTATAGSPAPIGSQPSSGPDATASVEADWTAFFDPTTPIQQRISLLQDGAKFRSYLEVQAQPGLAHLTTEQATAASVFGTIATVTYNILVSGRTGSALENLSGQAMFVGGTWQVSDADFCSLLTLENKGKTLPGC
jgi:hypothetical protein